MAKDVKERETSVKPRLVDELSEDLDVAVREFLERHPSTSTRRVRQAVHRMERGFHGGRARLVVAFLAMLVACAVGVVLGLSIGKGRSETKPDAKKSVSSESGGPWAEGDAMHRVLPSGSQGPKQSQEEALRAPFQSSGR